MLGILAKLLVGPMTHPQWDTAASTILILSISLLYQNGSHTCEDGG